MFKILMNKYAFLVIAFALAGCGLTEGVMQKESKSYLLFTGNTKDAVAYIDDNQEIILNPTISYDSSDTQQQKRTNNIQYEISPGKHSIVVKKSNVEVVNRIVLLGNGITKEIKIP